MRRISVALVLAALSLAAPHLVSAQSVFESAGERALGMGGAFVAVADDSTAVHWNPAGLVAGKIAGMTVGWQRFQLGKPQGAPVAGALRRTSTFTSLGTWPLGVSYGHFQTTNLVAGEGGELVVETLRTRQIGVTVLQTVTDGLVVGTTLKYLRGSFGTQAPVGLTASEAFDQASSVDRTTVGRFDLDVGVMADMEKVRVGLAIKNLREPSFARTLDPAGTLKRQARLGVALLPTDGLTLAMDIALDTVDPRGGLRRTFALGGEGRLGRRMAVRSGMRWSLVGDRRPIAALGLSLLLRRGLWLDGHYSHGNVNEAREFGVALRAGL